VITTPKTLDDESNALIKLMILVETITFSIWIIGPIVEMVVKTFDKMYCFVFTGAAEHWVCKVPFIGGFCTVARKYIPLRYRRSPTRCIVVVYSTVLVVSTVFNLSAVRAGFWEFIFKASVQVFKIPFDLLSMIIP
jgi:hypothetical protein